MSYIILKGIKINKDRLILKGYENNISPKISEEITYDENKYPTLNEQLKALFRDLKSYYIRIECATKVSLALINTLNKNFENDDKEVDFFLSELSRIKQNKIYSDTVIIEYQDKYIGKISFKKYSLDIIPKEFSRYQAEIYNNVMLRNCGKIINKRR